MCRSRTNTTATRSSARLRNKRRAADDDDDVVFVSSSATTKRSRKNTTRSSTQQSKKKRSSRQAAVDDYDDVEYTDARADKRSRKSYPAELRNNAEFCMRHHRAGTEYLIPRNEPWTLCVLEAVKDPAICGPRTLDPIVEAYGLTHDEIRAIMEEVNPPPEAFDTVPAPVDEAPAPAPSPSRRQARPSLLRKNATTCLKLKKAGNIASLARDELTFCVGEAVSEPATCGPRILEPIMKFYGLDRSQVLAILEEVNPPVETFDSRPVVRQCKENLEAIKARRNAESDRRQAEEEKDAIAAMQRIIAVGDPALANHVDFMILARHYKMSIEEVHVFVREEKAKDQAQAKSRRIASTVASGAVTTATAPWKALRAAFRGGRRSYRMYRNLTDYGKRSFTRGVYTSLRNVANNSSGIRNSNRARLSTAGAVRIAARDEFANLLRPAPLPWEDATFGGDKFAQLAVSNTKKQIVQSKLVRRKASGPLTAPISGPRRIMDRAARHLRERRVTFTCN